MNEEVSFLESLYERAVTAGRLEDVFPDLIRFNVIRFILTKLWPEKLKEVTSECKHAFAVAEDGWHGRIDALQSQLFDKDDRFELRYAKSYVMSADLYILLVKYNNRFALCALVSDQVDRQVVRKEPHTVFEGEEKVYHYRIEGSTDLSLSDFRVLDRKAYTAVGIQIPRREINGIALLSIALCESRGIKNEALRAGCRQLLDARMKPRLTKNDSVDAARILKQTLEIIRQGDYHPFWDKITEMKVLFR